MKPIVREPSVRLALELICRSGLDRLAGRYLRPRGVIFALHRVKPSEPTGFDPNAPLEVTPEFLERTIVSVRAEGFRFVPLDDVPRLLASGAREPFAVVTLDDAYRDNRDFAAPVFTRHRVPYTIFVPEAFVDGTGQIWWVELERAIRALDRVSPPGSAPTLSCRTLAEKKQAFERIYWALRERKEDEARAFVRELCRRAGIDVGGLCRELIMSWDELREMAKDPLASFGAHTSGHYALAKLGLERARAEMAGSRRRLEAELRRPCRHFCYPYGDEDSAAGREFDLARELGFETAVTMRKSLIDDHHLGSLTALPRCSLNGDYQDQRYVRALLSGVPFRLWKLVRAVNSLRRPQTAPAPSLPREASS